VHSIDFQLRDLLYLNIFFLVIYETKKTNKNEICQLARNYEKEMASVESLLQAKTNGFKQKIEKMEKENIKEKLRLDNLMLEQQKRYEKLLKGMNSRPPLSLHLRPPSPPPSLFLQQNLLLNASSLAPVNRPTITPIIQQTLATPIEQRASITHASIQPVSPIGQYQSTAPMQRENIDSLQFFGCPDNYTRPTVRVY